MFFKLPVKVVMVTIKRNIIFLHLDSILAKIFGGHTPPYSLAVEISY